MPEARGPDWLDPLWSRVPLPLTCEAHALGLALRLRTNASAIRLLFEAAFGAVESGPRTSDSIEHDHDLTLDVVVDLDEDGRWEPGQGSADVAAPRSGDRAADAPDPSPRHHAPGRSFHRELGPLYTAGDDRGSVVVADLATGTAAAFVARACRADIARLVLLESPLWRLATARGMVALHAATLEVDGVGLVLRGASGAGKSTLAAEALAAGWPVLSDEVTWWDGGDSGEGEDGQDIENADPSRTLPVLRGLGRWIHLEAAAAAKSAATSAATSAANRAGTSDPAADASRTIATGDSAPPGAPRGKRALRVPPEQRATALPPGPLVLLMDVSAPRPSRSRWQRLERDAARTLFDDMRIRGEGSQPPARFAAARDALVAGGAYGLWAGAPADALAALRAIAADWRSRRGSPRSGAAESGTGHQIGTRRRDDSE